MKENEINWEKVRQENMPRPKPKREPKVDEVVSKIVGRKVLVNDPKLVKIVRNWKGNKPNDSAKPDNFLEDSNKIKELKKELG